MEILVSISFGNCLQKIDTVLNKMDTVSKQFGIRKMETVSKSVQYSIQKVKTISKSWHHEPPYSCAKEDGNLIHIEQNSPLIFYPFVSVGLPPVSQLLLVCICLFHNTDMMQLSRLHRYFIIKHKLKFDYYSITVGPRYNSPIGTWNSDSCIRITFIKRQNY